MRFLPGDKPAEKMDEAFVMKKQQKGPVSASYREILRIAFPLVITSASFTVQNFCDRMFLAWHDPVALQAAVPAGILFFTLVCGFMATAAFANSLVAQYYGSGDRKSCSRSVAQALFLSAMSFPLILLLLPVGRWMISVSGHAAEVQEMEQIYFSILMLGGVALPLNSAVGSFFSGRGRTRTIMVCALIGTAVNLVLNRWFIFGGGPVPEMGIAGAAIATTLAGFVSPLIMLWIYFSRRTDRVYQTRNLFYFDGPLFRRLLRFGVPSGIHLALEIGSFSFFVQLVGRLGDTALTAANIALSVNLIAFMPAIGIGHAAGTLTGQHLGRRDRDGAMLAGWRAMRIGLVYTVLAALSFVFFPEFYIRMFARGAVNFDEVYPVVRILLLFAAGWGLMNAASLILSGALRGAGDTRFVMWFQTGLGWLLFVPGELLIIVVWQMDVMVAWAWALVYITLLSLGMILRFRSKRWQRIELIERDEPMIDATEGMPAI